VRVMSLNMDGQLLENPREGMVGVPDRGDAGDPAAGTAAPAQKAEAQEAEKRAARRSATNVSGAGEIAMQKALHISPELMLRAMRVEEAQPVLDKYVDDAYAAGISQARIIHGKGSGVLR